METNFPTLYKKTSTGAIQSWAIRVFDNEITTYHGQLGGKIQTSAPDVITEGKNLGKKNETTPSEQAVKEAQARWEKQVKKGYVEDVEDARAGAVNEETIKGGVFPMLAHPYDKQGHKIKWPCYVQPKYDGIRCIAHVKDGVCTLWSRTRKLITGVPHIARAVEAAFPTGEKMLDGELYNHAYKHDFEKIVSFVRQETPKEGHEVVQYWVYDYVDDVDRFDRRQTVLRYWRTTLPSFYGDHPLCIAPTASAADEDELMVIFRQFLAEGYEGVIARNADGLYTFKRSYDLQKIKQFEDAEFKIIGVEEGRGKMKGHVARVVCVTSEGNEFDPPLNAPMWRLKELWEDSTLWEGKQLTVRFQGWTNKNGVPRIPKGIAIRDYE